MKVAISGSRTFTDRLLVERVVHRLIDRGDSIILGDAREGVDLFARVECGCEATIRAVDYKVYKADWDTYRKRAGFLRNEAMIHDADMLIAIFAPGPPTPGTSQAVRIAKKKPIPVYVFHEGVWVLSDPTGSVADAWLAVHPSDLEGQIIMPGVEP